jgi:CRP-like cAMP-binding protein
MLNYNHFSYLEDTKIFSQFEKKVLQKIALDFKLIKLPKGKKLFVQEDIAKNFYIVCDGAIVLSYLNQDGEELIIEIAGENDFLQDIFASDFIANSRAIKDSTILSIDRSKIIDLLKNNHEFAFNFLQKNSQRNQLIQTHLIDLKSNNSKFKVANFLLGLMFEQGNKNQQILLKYDKSLIASYLGIKPETFSRILKKLTNEGEIVIKKNLITFLKIDSLCKYCNLKTSEKCQDKKCQDDKKFR